MNRVGRNGRNGSHEHRRGRSVTAIPTTTDDKLLDLFSRSRTAHSLSVSVDESQQQQQQQAKLSVIGSVALSKTGMLSSSSLDLVDGGKHDYDWLLTPPETPLFPSSDATEHQPTVAARKPSFTSRSASTTKASRLSVGQSADSSYCSRPARSSSVTRPSISSMSYNTHSSSSHRSSVLNTSSASVSSIPRPSTPAARSTATSYSRPSTPAGSRSSVSSSVSSRPSTPTKPRPTPSSSFSGEKTRSLQNSRPSTPSSRPQIPANLNSSSARTNSRPSMPSHRNAASSPSTLFTSRSFSGEQVPTNGRIRAAASRGSSPSPRTRPIPQPVVLPDFPLETPPNLRTTLPERPVSAGRSRPNSGVTAKGSADAPPRRQSLSPVVTRGRLPAELSTKGRLHANGHDFGATDNQRTPPSSESASRRLTKSLSSAEGNGFGRTISKKSLDVALRHVDIRHGSANGNTRSLSGTAIFPQSIRSATSKGQQARPLETSVAVNVNGNGAPPYLGGNISTLENGNHKVRSQDGNAYYEDVKRLSAKVSDLDIYESSRYDALLLREDAKNTNWLHSIDDKSDEGSIFDNRFDILPEPFDPL